jgi:cell wall-associated NlpC family hydrolase
MSRGKHGAAVAGLHSWRKILALVVSVATAGAWIPFTTGGTLPESQDPDDDEEQFTIPAPVFEGHEFPTWPMAAVPGNTQHTSPPTPPKPKPKVEEHRAPTAKPNPVVKKVTPTPVATKPTSVLVSFLRAQLGKRYLWGGNGPSAYDCSGLAKAAYAKVGVHLPRTSEQQSLVGERVSLSHLKVGDLLFWGAGPGSAYHVAIYVGGNKFIAAQNPLMGVVEMKLSSFPPSFARRVL